LLRGRLTQPPVRIHWTASVERQRCYLFCRFCIGLCRIVLPCAQFRLCAVLKSFSPSAGRSCRQDVAPRPRRHLLRSAPPAPLNKPQGEPRESGAARGNAVHPGEEASGGVGAGGYTLINGSAGTLGTGAGVSRRFLLEAISAWGRIRDVPSQPMPRRRSTRREGGDHCRRVRPGQGLHYAMTCVAGVPTIFSGGNSAVVYIR